MRPRQSVGRISTPSPSPLSLEGIPLPSGVDANADYVIVQGTTYKANTKGVPARYKE